MQQSSVIDNLPEISDEYMRESRAKTRSYTLAILKKGPGYDPPRSEDPAVKAGVLTFEVHPTFISRATACRANDAASSGRALAACLGRRAATALAGARGYTVRILKRRPNYDTPEAEAIIREHGRRNLALYRAGVLAIMGPIRDGGDVAGVSIFDAEPEEVERITTRDPAVQAGMLTFEVHPAIGFPGDCLPDGPISRAD
jgi:YCII-related domain